jgi:hypothetical protein
MSCLTDSQGSRDMFDVHSGFIAANGRLVRIDGVTSGTQGVRAATKVSRHLPPPTFNTISYGLRMYRQAHYLASGELQTEDTQLIR